MDVVMGVIAIHVLAAYGIYIGCKKLLSMWFHRKYGFDLFIKGE
jgi:hypothetical protein